MRRLLALPADEARLLAAAAISLCGIALALELFGFARLQKALERLASRSRGSRDVRRARPERIGWAVETAARAVPGANTCLTKALAGRWMMRRAGHPASLRIGVRADRGRRLIAHAWVELDGQRVVGAREAAEFTPLGAVRGDPR